MTSSHAWRAGGVLVQWIYADNEEELLDSAIGSLCYERAKWPALMISVCLTMYPTLYFSYDFRRLTK